jgi:uncharacterized protein (TIGR02147 family)
VETTQSNYRTYLRAALAERIKRNPSYSMRAMAGLMGITPSGLCQVLKGKKNLSPSAAIRIAGRLGLEPSDARYFCELVELETAKTAEHRAAVLERISAMNPERVVRDLSVDQFQIISDWYHYAIVELTESDIASFDPAAIARRLGISRIEVEAAIERLLRLEMLEPHPDKPGFYRKTNESFQVSSDVSSAALRKFHQQILEKAAESLEQQRPGDRIIGSETFAFAPEQLPEFRELVAEFYRKAVALADRGTGKTEVYNLGVNFFSLAPSGGTPAERGKK